MVSLNNIETALVTSDGELYSIILESYPGIIKEEQISKKRVNGRKIYTIDRLELNEINRFLRKYNQDNL